MPRICLSDIRNANVSLIQVVLTSHLDYNQPVNIRFFIQEYRNCHKLGTYFSPSQEGRDFIRRDKKNFQFGFELKSIDAAYELSYHHNRYLHDISKTTRPMWHLFEICHGYSLHDIHKESILGSRWVGGKTRTKYLIVASTYIGIYMQ